MLHTTVGRTALRRQAAALPPLFGVRHKSEPARHVDDFPYKHLNSRDVSHMSAEMESTARLPLRSFFAQHRPLMPFARPAHAEDLAEDNATRWVHVPVHPARPLFMSEDMNASWCVIPEKVAHQLGPFDRENLMNRNSRGGFSSSAASINSRGGSSGSSGISGSSSGSISSSSLRGGVSHSGRSMHPPLNASEVQSMLNKQFPILMQHLQKMTGSGDAEFHVIPLNLERPEPVYDEEDGLEATSVQRKRKLKMNRHKYRKRLKEQRTKRRRLGK